MSVTSYKNNIFSNSEEIYFRHNTYVYMYDFCGVYSHEFMIYWTLKYHTFIENRNTPISKKILGYSSSIKSRKLQDKKLILYCCLNGIISAAFLRYIRDHCSILKNHFVISEKNDNQRMLVPGRMVNVLELPILALRLSDESQKQHVAWHCH